MWTLFHESLHYRRYEQLKSWGFISGAALQRSWPHFTKLWDLLIFIFQTNYGNISRASHIWRFNFCCCPLDLKSMTVLKKKAKDASIQGAYKLSEDFAKPYFHKYLLTPWSRVFCLQRKHLSWVILNMYFLRRRVVSTTPNPQAGGPHLVGCPRLLIQFIHSYPPYRRPFLHPQPEDAPCRGDRDPHIFTNTVQNYIMLLPFERGMFAVP
jgi:hypothetical protein